jgi:metal-responsive CopG/Arc/MetJ family transcriptional regulator
MAETTENRVKIGAQVNESVYAEFKQYIEDKTGQKRGVLGEAVEAALRQYMEDDGRDVDRDVSNAALVREIRALRSSD